MARDYTQAEFDRRCEKHGFVRQQWGGYYKTPSGVHVSALNAGTRRRNQLAYLIQENRRWIEKKEQAGEQKTPRRG